jgi:hypothetical protein
MDPLRPRKGKPLLLATVGLATVSFVACNEPQQAAPETTVEQSASSARPAESAPPPPASATAPPAAPADSSAPDAGTSVTDAGAPDAGDAGAKKVVAPVVRPRPPFHHPVGNLRPPD